MDFRARGGVLQADTHPHTISVFMCSMRLCRRPTNNDEEASFEEKLVTNAIDKQCPVMQYKVWLASYARAREQSCGRQFDGALGQGMAVPKDPTDPPCVNSMLRPAAVDSSNSYNPDHATEIDRHPCPICIERFLLDDHIRALPCGHVFHSSCLGAWLSTRHLWCPLCRGDILTLFPHANTSHQEPQFPPAALVRDR